MRNGLPSMKNPARRNYEALQATEGMPASSAAVIKSRIFVTKLDQQVTVAGLKEYVKELTGSVCEIEKLEVRGSNFFYLLQ